MENIDKYIYPPNVKRYRVKMAKQKRTPLEKIQTLKSKKVARLFFGYFMTCGFVTRLLHEKVWKDYKVKNKHGFVMPYIRDCFNEWKDVEFIEKSPFKLKYIIRKKNCKPYFQYNYAYRLNLNPFYLYCKEKKKVDFTSKEQELLNYILRSQIIRENILRENPDEDIITAILIFYIKHFALPYGEIGDKKEIELYHLAENSIEKGFEEEFRKENEEMCMDMDESRKFQNMNKKEKEKFWKIKNLKTYALLYKTFPKLFKQINIKFKKALGILS